MIFFLASDDSRRALVTERITGLAVDYTLCLDEIESPGAAPRQIAYHVAASPALVVAKLAEWKTPAS